MKRVLAILLATLLLLSCLPALSEATYYEALGFSLDFSDIEAQSVNYPFLLNYGTVKQEPYLAVIELCYYNLPEEDVLELQRLLDATEDEEEYALIDRTLDSMSAFPASIVVTDAKDPADVGLDKFFEEAAQTTELGTVGDYHYYYFTYPTDDMLPIYNELEDAAAAEEIGEDDVSLQEMREADLADIRMVQSELLKKLQAVELSEPSNPGKALIGQSIEFESVDLDGNPVKSADLFKDNRITMVNVWGTWCINCMNEMGELAEIQKHLAEKGCGIVGVEWEKKPIEDVADKARQALAQYGITYPNVIMPQSDPIFDTVTSFPTTLFVDSTGKILTYPIRGAAVDQYEPAVEALLSGETTQEVPTTSTGVTANESGAYRVIVYDTDGNPVKGAVIQLCDDTTCTLQKTDAEGVATFQVEAQKVYEVHLAKVPEGYVSSDETYKTMDTFSDVNIFVSKAA